MNSGGFFLGEAGNNYFVGYFIRAIVFKEFNTFSLFFTYRAIFHFNRKNVVTFRAIVKVNFFMALLFKDYVNQSCDRGKQ